MRTRNSCGWWSCSLCSLQRPSKPPTGFWPRMLHVSGATAGSWRGEGRARPQSQCRPVPEQERGWKDRKQLPLCLSLVPLTLLFSHQTTVIVWSNFVAQVPQSLQCPCIYISRKLWMLRLKQTWRIIMAHFSEETLSTQNLKTCNYI